MTLSNQIIVTQLNGNILTKPKRRNLNIEGEKRKHCEGYIVHDWSKNLTTCKLISEHYTIAIRIAHKLVTQSSRGTGATSGCDSSLEGGLRSNRAPPQGVY